MAGQRRTEDDRADGGEWLQQSQELRHGQGRPCCLAAAVGEYNFQAVRPTSSQVYTLKCKPCIQSNHQAHIPTKCPLMLSCATFDAISPDI